MLTKVHDFARDLPMRARDGRFEFLGLRLDDMDGDAIAAAAAAAVRERRSLLVLNANAHMVVLTKREPWLRDLLNRADIAFCDGAGVQLAAWALNGHRPHRTTPPEWIDRFAAQLPAGASVFWLGGAPDVVDAAAQRFSKRHAVRIAGVQHGFFDHRAGSDENEALIRRINQASPDVLLVTMGMPLQERWLDENWRRLDVRVAIAAGALVDHVAGRVQRPSAWVADAGLEWLVRLVREPKRLWRRYILGLPVFGLYVLLDFLDPRRLGRRSRTSERARSVT
jgi:N-acetylglucosaminyldiphosphoundecaprenol N-acetyl-beta-D-mannosaminyltransferase